MAEIGDIIERLTKWATSDPLTPPSDIEPWDWGDVTALIAAYKGQAEQLADTKAERDEAVTANHSFRACKDHTLEATNPFETSCLVCQLAAKDSMIESWKKEEQAWAETDMQRDASLAAADAFAQAHEAWEADLIEHGDWSSGTVRLTQAQHDRLISIQTMRNAYTATRSKGDTDAKTTEV